jgi:hypothetical protein
MVEAWHRATRVTIETRRILIRHTIIFLQRAEGRSVVGRCCGGERAAKFPP